jgi:hypothetical protein
MSSGVIAETQNFLKIGREIVSRSEDILIKVQNEKNQSLSPGEITCTNFPFSELNKNNLSEDSTGSEINSEEIKNQLINNLQSQKINKDFSGKFSCKICSKILYSPNITKCCGETACHDCFNAYILISTCPFCKMRNFKVMPNFKIQKMKEMIIKKFNIGEFDAQPGVLHNAQHAPGKNNFNNFIPSVTGMHFPVSNNNLFINNQFKFVHPGYNFNNYNRFTGNKLAPMQNHIFRLFSNARFFVIKSFNLENIEISKAHNKWATTKNNSRKLNEALESSYVILLFSANKSGCFQGFALMTNFISNYYDKRDNNIWKIGEGGNATRFNLGASFDIEWISHSELTFHKMKNLYNPMNNNEPVAKSRDTQELPKDLGIKICKMFGGNRNLNIEETIEKIEKARRKMRQGYQEKNPNLRDNKKYDNSNKYEKREKYINKKRGRSRSKSSRSSVSSSSSYSSDSSSSHSQSKFRSSSRSASHSS